MDLSESELSQYIATARGLLALPSQPEHAKAELNTAPQGSALALIKEQMLRCADNLWKLSAYVKVGVWYHPKLGSSFRASMADFYKGLRPWACMHRASVLQ
jgi:hypothetical protein